MTDASKGIDAALGYRLIALRERIAPNFAANNWDEIGLLTGATDLIEGHPRLFRSLRFGDDDYAACVLAVLHLTVLRAPSILPIIERYVDLKFPGESQYISAKPAERKITFAPHVFHVPDGYVELDLVAVMMPFAQEFDPVHHAIQRACQAHRLRCQRADNIWQESVIIQDIFSLIFKAHVVVVDFSGKNPNVMYETGIAHTLGKHVVPIARSLDDVPFDMRHHRVAKYLPNTEGFARLQETLAEKLRQFAVPEPAPPAPPPASGDDIPF